MNIEPFCPKEEFEKRVDKLIRDIKSSARMDGVNEILIPGELESRTREERLRSGIVIPEITWNTTLSLARQYGVQVDKITKSA